MKKVLSVVVAILMVTALAIPAFAADPIVDATNKMKVSFTKELKLSNFSNVESKIPDLTFSYDIAAGTAVEATATNPEIKAGLNAASVVIGDAVFTQETRTGATTYSGTTNTFTVPMDFSAITFAQPGVYRYILTENATANENSGVNGAIDFDTNTYVVDLYITTQTSEGVTSNSIANVIMYKLAEGDTAPTPTYTDETKKTVAYDADGAASAKKVDKITNQYNIYHLDLKKNVTGEMGDTSKDFSFTIELANGPKSFSVNAKKTTQAGATEDVVVTFDENGAATLNITLKHGEEFEIWSLPRGTTYEITENLSAADKANYQVTFTGADAFTAGEYVGTGALTNASDDVAVQNHFGQITPTGLFLTYGPYVLIVLAAAAIAVVFLRRRRSNNLVDDLA